MVNKILTFANYDFSDIRFLAMAIAWMDTVRKHWDGEIIVQSKVPISHAFLPHMNESDVIFKVDPEQYEGAIKYDKFKMFRWKTDHNIRYKMFHLCKQDSPVFYIDLDCIALSDIRDYTNRHKESVVFPTRNGGILLLNNPTVMNWETLINASFDQNFRPTRFGSDQTLYWEIFPKNAFQGEENWNASPTNLEFVKRNNQWIAYWPSYLKKARIIHYMSDSKPWEIECPIYREYLDRITNTPCAEGFYQHRN